MQNKTFRLFVSSPFSDFKKERDVLHKKVFSRVDKYCNENGFSFQPIDLRWGVSNEAQHDQKTLEVCLEEVRACKHFPYPNFLIMAGDRYGYVPLPYMIEKSEFDKILEILKNNKEKVLIKYEVIKDEKSEVLSQKVPKEITKLELLEEWYKLDENQIPISYVLKPRADEYKDSENWKKDQEELRIILQYAANKIFDNKDNQEYLKYFTSATEAEVLEGILDYKNITPTQEKLIENKIVENSKLDKEYVYGYIRTIQNPTEKYIDSTKDKEEENFLKQKAIDFKTNLTNTLNKDKNILTSSYDSIELYEENQLKEFEEFIYEKLINAIETQKNKSNEISKIDQEILEQKKFKDDKQKGFIGREDTLNKIDDYVLNDKTNEPLIIYGISGMGKSSLIAKSIDNVSKLIPKNSLIYRFVGATQNSTTIKTLLISICDELVSKNIIEKIDEYEYDEYKFFKQINQILSNIEKPIVLFIDALDQLQSKDSLQWFPENLNENFKVVFSVLNDEKYKEDTLYFNILKNKVNSNNLIDISNDSLESSKEELVKNLLSDLNRKIDDYQTKYLLDKWKATNYSPLYLKIAIEEVKHWKSGDETQKLESNVEGIIKEYIENLSKIYHHEEILVNKVFGYIHASKDGLSEKELLEILSEDLEDESLMQKKILNKHHESIKVKNFRRENKEELVLPMSIWSRLHTQIKPFIIERNIDHQPLMKFFHRQFTSVVDELIKDNKIQLHKKLSSYFYTLQNKNETWDKRYHNLHMLAEYPYQVYKTKKYPRILKSILFDLEFAGSIYNNNKQDSFRDIMSKATQLDNITEDKLYPWESFYREKEHLILKVDEELWRPHQSLFQLAYEDGLDSPLHEVAKNLLEKEKVNWYWLKNNFTDINMYRNGLINNFSLKNHLSKIDSNYFFYGIHKVKQLSNNDILITTGYLLPDYTNNLGILEIQDPKDFILLYSKDKIISIDEYGKKECLSKYIKTREVIEYNNTFVLENKDKVIVKDNVLKIESINGIKEIVNEHFCKNNIDAIPLNFNLILSWIGTDIYINDPKLLNTKPFNKENMNPEKLIVLKDNNYLSIDNNMLSIFCPQTREIKYKTEKLNFDIDGALEIDNEKIFFWSANNIYYFIKKDCSIIKINVLEENIFDVLKIVDNKILLWLKKELIYIFNPNNMNLEKIFIDTENYDFDSNPYFRINENEIIYWDISGCFFKYEYMDKMHYFKSTPLGNGDERFEKQLISGEVFYLDEKNNFNLNFRDYNNYANKEISIFRLMFDDSSVIYYIKDEKKIRVYFNNEIITESKDIDFEGKIIYGSYELTWSTVNKSKVSLINGDAINYILFSNNDSIEWKNKEKIRFINNKFKNLQILPKNAKLITALIVFTDHKVLNLFSYEKELQKQRIPFLYDSYKFNVQFREENFFIGCKQNYQTYKLNYGNKDITTNNTVDN